MCYLLTIGTRESRNAIKALLGDDSLLSARKSQNPHVRAAFPKGDHLFEVVQGQCSCNLIPPQTEPRDPAKLKARYERRGWSESKISRALRDRENARGPNSSVDARTQLYALMRVLANRAGGVRALLHSYSGQYNTETVTITNEINVAIDAIERGGLPEDTLATIVV